MGRYYPMDSDNSAVHIARKEQTMSRYIDADALIDRLDFCVKEGMGSKTAYTFKHMVGEAPSIDIVFCKECKHRKKNGFCLEHNRYEKNDNGYCSYGERDGE